MSEVRPTPFGVGPQWRKMRTLLVDDVSVKVYEADVPVFLAWIQEGQHPVYFICGTGDCKYRGTVKLSEQDVAYAGTGAAIVQCPACQEEVHLRILVNSHELTRKALGWKCGDCRAGAHQNCFDHDCVCDETDYCNGWKGERPKSGWRLAPADR